MIIAILNPLGKLYRLNRRRYRQHADVCLVCDAGVGYLFYAIYLLCTRPHDSRLVQIYLLLMGTLMLPWGLVLLITCIMREIKVNQALTPSPVRDKRRLTMRTQPFSLLAVHAILCGL